MVGGFFIYGLRNFSAFENFWRVFQPGHFD
jgi:hypothetical protein